MRPPPPTRARTQGLVRVYEAVIAACCALIPALVAARAALNLWNQYLPDALHVQGVWLALAQDLTRGVFYRPLAGALGYGGTRYMPLYFALTAALAPSAGGVEVSGLLVSAASVILLAFVCHALLRRLGVGALLSAAATAALLASGTTQRALLETRGDGLATMLNAAGFLLCVTGRPRRRTLLLAAALFAAAFSAKLTSVFGVAAVVAGWTLARRRREALELAAATACGYALVLVLIQVLSGGRALDIFRVCASSGTGLLSAATAPLRLVRFATDTDPAVLLFGLPAAVLALARLTRDGPDPLADFFLASLLATTAIFASPGTAGNHLLDLIVPATLVCALAVSRDEALKELGTGLFAAALVLGCATTALDLRADLHAPIFRTDLRAALRDLPDDGRPILAENPAVVLALGGTPYLMDPFEFRIASRARPELARRLHDEMSARAFSAIVLMKDPTGPDGTRWYTDVHFGGAFLDDLAADYELARLSPSGTIRVFTPRPAAP